MASIDLNDAYYIVPIENFLQNFFAFQFQGEFYTYACSPSGLISTQGFLLKS